MDSPLAVPGDDDRAVRPDVGEETVPRLRNIGISRVECLLCFRLGGQERAEIGLAIARCPNVAGIAENGGLPLDEEFGAVVRDIVVQRGVP